jgi:hypothetical protein
MAHYHDAPTATLLTDARVLVVGGSANPDAPATAELFDPGTGRWTATKSMARAGEGHTATLLTDGRVLVVGGYSGDWLAKAELYDPGSESWTATGSLTTARGGHTATLLTDGRVLVVGGSLGETGSYTSSAAAELYDPRSGKWTATASMGTARPGHTATRLLDGRVLVTGGTSDSINIEGLTSAELYDPGSGTWTATGSMAEARFGHKTILLSDGSVLVAGGRRGGPYGGDGWWLATAELYDPHSGAWRATASMDTGRADHTATRLLDGRVLVTGGTRDDGIGIAGHSRSAELYDPGSGKWTATATMATLEEIATLLLDGRVLASGVDGTAELYDPGGPEMSRQSHPTPA